MRYQRQLRRHGFTLLEVMLASVLAMILMAALYVALDVQLRLADEGREAVAQATVVRAVVHRLNTDLTNGLGAMTPPPKSGGNSSTGTGGTTGTGGMTGMTTGMTTTTEGTVMEEEAAMTATAIPLRAGLIGTSYANDDSGRLTIFVSRVAGIRNADDSGEGTNPSDIWRITYWQTPNGLARQALPWVTSDTVRTTDEPIIEEGKEEQDYVIAEEVVRIQFEFWDAAGQTWATDWDGQELGPDGITPKGPPMAVRVRFWMMVPDPAGSSTKVEKEFRQTIALLTASGPATSDADTAAADQATMQSTPMMGP